MAEKYSEKVRIALREHLGDNDFSMSSLNQESWSGELKDCVTLFLGKHASLTKRWLSEILKKPPLFIEGKLK
jgi:hypothetical protein